MALGRILILGAAGLAGFALLLLIISVGVPNWLDDGTGNTIGLFRECYSENSGFEAGCRGANRVTQGGLSVFGILLLVCGIGAAIAGHFLVERFPIILVVSLVLMYFASMFVMAAYATWGQYSRDDYSWRFPYSNVSTTNSHTSMGSGYHLCVAAHYFLWSALTLLAYGVGLSRGQGTQATS